jgi:hypothetical protein
MSEVVLIVIAGSTVIGSLAYITKNISRISCCFKLCDCEQVTRQTQATQQTNGSAPNNNEPPTSPTQQGFFNMLRDNINTMLQVKQMERNPNINIQLPNIQPINNNEVDEEQPR